MSKKKVKFPKNYTTIICNGIQYIKPVVGDQVLSMSAYDKDGKLLAVLIPTKKISNKKIKAIGLMWRDERGLRHTRFLSGGK